MYLDSDLHNFGKRARLEDGFILKARPLFCEYQLFSPESKFRKMIRKIFEEDISLLPVLDFPSPTFVPTIQYQKMELLDLAPLSSPLPDEKIEQLGGILAIINCLGISDLHCTNILFGESGGKSYFAPIDLEVFASHYTMSDSGFLPRNLEHYSCCPGIRHFFDYQKRFFDPTFSNKVIHGYLRYLNGIESHFEAFICAFYDKGLDGEIVSRVLIRDTALYVKALAGEIELPFIPEELEQLRRGDVPYFFSFLDGNGEIYYWVSQENYSRVTSTYPEIYQSIRKGHVPDFKALRAGILRLTALLDIDRSFIGTSTSYESIDIFHRARSKFVRCGDVSEVIGFEKIKVKHESHPI